MNAKICDRCGVLWKNDGECNIEIRCYHIKEENRSDKDYYDLCSDCANGMWAYLDKKD